jgi:hypothetical protein
MISTEGGETIRAGASPAELLAPNGVRIGQAGARKSIRVIKGGQTEARVLFEQLARGGTPYVGAYGGKGVTLPDGDFVGLRTYTTLGNEAAQRVTLQIIREAMETGEVVAGEFAEKDRETLIFVPWSLTVDETVARIKREWIVEKELNPGEIAWFVAPTLLPITANKHPMGEHWQPKNARMPPDP